MDEIQVYAEVTTPSVERTVPIVATSLPEEVAPVAEATSISPVAPALTPQEPLVLQVSTPLAPQTPPDPLLSSAPQETVRIVEKEVIREVPVEK